ncbi:cilia- and flagella-associated protein 206 isoform X1 [Heterocephalus glaber]|uniref:Cilia- and flagella-associated protein 206 n=1 Tax=Heterocephalus glaber TaxID=10181 RepID=A0A0P6J391_HETGA|nr:cilia- and flagella-associated protein 206 isoform X1 [Heterocephalus glaber]XP_021096433.1 cilia- and flagella-associated protein 206 isoform X1 [Heterocephalus glaber]XP_021096434.1 cilia- and flagella-associated protein 206 isoform X1 [Heterocephalus glaber]XP_021096435.1 cilia- and flagella-associated protein 206 isoform X1 [Heterocephalus glaber]
MPPTQAESVIKNIIREIGQECASHGEIVSETLVAFMVKAVVLDPSNGFNIDRTLVKTDVQKLVKLCVTRLLDSKNPSLDTIKMQVYFDMNYTSREDFLEEHHRVLESRLSSVSREITDNRASTREELESLYQKIVSYMLLRSGLGSPTDIKIVRETTAALQSVFPQAELGTFLTLSKMDKECQLKELTTIVTGIRLFNRDCGKGGEGIDDLPAILHEAIPATTQYIDSQLQNTQDQLYHYTAILEKVTKNPLMGKELQQYMIKEALYNMRQYEIFLQIILSDVISCAQEVEMMMKQLAAQLEQLKMTIRSKTAVPTSQVFPIFIALANLWTSFQDETVLISILSNLTTHLEPFLGAHEVLFPEKIMQGLLDDMTVKTDASRIKEHMEYKVHLSDFKKLEWLFPETTENFDKLLIQYRGFCGYTFATTDGLLLPGNPTIGILKHKEKYYTFNTRDAAYSFAENPEKYIDLIKEKAKKHAELIQLLELHQQFETLIPYSQMRDVDKHYVKPITKCESSTQTDTHILPPTIVRSYEWNEWELRRKAIKLASLRQKITHSVQTDLSHMRRENCSQVYPSKNAGTLSMREDGTQVPRPQIYISGLRGGQSKVSHGVKVNLTRAVDKT